MNYIHFFITLISIRLFLLIPLYYKYKQRVQLTLFVLFIEGDEALKKKNWNLFF